MNKNRWLIVAALVAVVGGAWLWLNRAPAEALALRTEPAPAVGHPAPDFTLTTLDGAPFVLSEQRGTPIVLNFWATWCGPCQRELPELERAAAHYGGSVAIVGVDQGEEAAVVQGTVDELGLTFAIPMDSEFAVGELYNVRGLPTTFFIDADGVIRNVWAGEMNSITLAENIRLIFP